jgi:hypothetical protein
MHPIQTRTLGIAGLVLLLGNGLSWAGGPPNTTPSDDLQNTAGGTEALFDNTTGLDNTAFGDSALARNTMGGANTAVGFNALQNNTTGGNNQAFGVAALLFNTTGNFNTASGVGALLSNTTGSDNIASGSAALQNNTTGGANTAVGNNALFGNTTGFENSVFGTDAGETNVAGSLNTFIGTGADANADYTNGTALGAGALLFTSNSIVLGNTSISAIFAMVPITVTSDRRRKKDIRSLDTDLGLDFIEKLKPVSYRFNNGDETKRYGFIAQDLEQALPASLHDSIERSEPEHGLALIERQNDKDRTYRVTYDELFAPIVKSIQQQQQNADLRHALADQAAAFKADLRRALEDQAATFKAETAALHRSIDALKGQVREQLSAAR